MKCNNKACNKETRGGCKVCESCKAKEYRKNHPDKIRAYNEMRYIRDKDKISSQQKYQRDKTLFNGKRQEVLERDNFECQGCGMSQEKHFVLFNTALIIHHKDGYGRGEDNPNNDMENLITLCIRCHTKVHHFLRKVSKYGHLLEQDGSEWKYPKIREMVQAHIDGGLGVGEAKRIVGENTLLKYTTVDNYYYEKKETSLNAEKENLQ